MVVLLKNIHVRTQLSDYVLHKIMDVITYIYATNSVKPF